MCETLFQALVLDRFACWCKRQKVNKYKNGLMINSVCVNN